jgi:hypothetical protein
MSCGNDKLNCVCIFVTLVSDVINSHTEPVQLHATSFRYGDLGIFHTSLLLLILLISYCAG